MENKLLEGEYGHGAIPTKTIKKMPTMGQSSQPFDWNLGFDVGELVTKDQGPSDSCGGQATAYKGEAESKVPKSARFPYCQVFAQGGGSSEGDLIKIVVTEGLADEAIFPSYDKGQPPTEQFMENDSDLTSSVLLNAQGLQGIPSYIVLDFDSIAEAVRDNGGCIIGIYGQNGLTPSWLSTTPQPPTLPIGNQLWAHWVFVGRAQLINGVKTLSFKNSWGNYVGQNGWQSITETYLPYIFSAWTFDKSKYVFSNNMWFGCSNEDVFALQAKLGIPPTGGFWSKTFSAVQAYQKAHGISATGFVGTQTRASLNA